ncbi:MAG: riboflavin synthase [Candidatus Omnitrophota bacterium]|nr:MAG: riboflavin synthase [Candidatus Omnitrophota bacterium]
MFSGIVEELGRVRSLDKPGVICRLAIFAPKTACGIQLGESVCVNGVCLSAVEVSKDELCFEVMQETLKLTNLGLLKRADKVNLERALGVGGRYSGHFVTGHIDATGTISKRQRKGSDVIMEVKSPNGRVLPYIALKGSVALEGVSLTVSAEGTDCFQVSLIPHTLNYTTLGSKKEGDLLNIECDILAKYIYKGLASKGASRSSLNPSFLRQHGFA